MSTTRCPATRTSESTSTSEPTSEPTLPDIPRHHYPDDDYIFCSRDYCHKNDTVLHDIKCSTKSNHTHKCSRNRCCKKKIPKPPGPVTEYKMGSNIIDNKVITCNNNNDCESKVCDPDLKTCIKLCEGKDDECKYIGSSKSLTKDNVKSKCVKSKEKFICPFGKIECNNNDNMVHRLCDPSSSCKSVGNISEYKCTNNVSPFIGFDNDNHYQVATTNENACWSKI